MSKKQKALVAVASVSCALLVASALAGSLTLNTPLYTFRMEQASSKMNFLPTIMNGFTYTTENGHTLNYDATGYCGMPLDVTSGKTCEGTCQGQETCQGYNTCDLTCWSTCPNTCGSTCPLTCDTCDHTCGTCETCITCRVTCIGSTCWETCFPCL